MHTYTVTIGRNIRDTPMSDYHWLMFQRSVIVAMTRDLSKVWDACETHHGTGTWDGVTEESAKITRLIEEPMSDAQLDWLRRDLAKIAREYSQDAIALQVCESELIAACEGVTA